MKTKSEDLEILLAVADMHGFSAAAEKLNLQVAKVSRAITRLEQQLDTTLLNRTTRRIELTEEGRAFIAKVRAGIETLLQAEDDLLSNDNMPRGRLRIDGASPFVLHQIVPHISDFQKAYPEITLELSSNEGYVDLLENKTDIAFRIGHLSDSSLHARFMGHSDLFITASPEYLAKQGVPKNFDELQQHSLLGFINSKNLNFWPLGDGIQITPTLASSNGEVIRELTLQGSGISCLSGFMIKKDLRSGRLVSLFSQAQMLQTDRRNIHALYYKTSAVSRRITAFLDFIKPKLSL